MITTAKGDGWQEAVVVGASDTDADAKDYASILIFIEMFFSSKILTFGSA